MLSPGLLYFYMIHPKTKYIEGNSNFVDDESIILILVCNCPPFPNIIILKLCLRQLFYYCFEFCGVPCDGIKNFRTHTYLRPNNTQIQGRNL